MQHERDVMGFMFSDHLRTAAIDALDKVCSSPDWWKARNRQHMVIDAVLDAVSAAINAHLADLERHAARWRECERLAVADCFDGDAEWRISGAVGRTLCEGIDAAIAKRKETT